MAKTNKQNTFLLKKCKIGPTGRLTISYQDDTAIYDGETPKHGVHDDLRESFAKLKCAIIASHRLDWPQVVFSPNLLDEPAVSGSKKALRKLLKECEAEIDKAVQVSGFSLSGDGDKTGVVVTGTIEARNKKKGTSSHRIQYNQDVFGFEEQLQLDVDAALHEIRAYLYSDKNGPLVNEPKNQLSMHLETPDEDDSSNGEDEKDPTADVKAAIKVIKPKGKK